MDLSSASYLVQIATSIFLSTGQFIERNYYSFKKEPRISSGICIQLNSSIINEEMVAELIAKIGIATGRKFFFGLFEEIIYIDNKKYTKQYFLKKRLKPHPASNP